MAAFVLGAVLLLIALVGGRFKLFGAEVSEAVGGTGRAIAGVMGIALIVFGLYGSVWPTPSPADEKSTPKAELQAVINDPDGFTNIRSGPGTQYEVISRVVNGELFYVLSPQGDWWRVRTREGKYGYIHRSRIKIKN